jgi:hypothetical protein
VNTHIIGRTTAHALAVVLLASGAAIGLTACQTATAPAPAPLELTNTRPLDRMLIEKYGGRPADRVAEQIERAIEDGQLPSQHCIIHHVVEHPAGGYRLVCVQTAE